MQSPGAAGSIVWPKAYEIKMLNFIFSECVLKLVSDAYFIIKLQQMMNEQLILMRPYSWCICPTCA